MSLGQLSSKHLESGAGGSGSFSAILSVQSHSELHETPFQKKNLLIIYFLLDLISITKPAKLIFKNSVTRGGLKNDHSAWVPTSLDC